MLVEGIVGRSAMAAYYYLFYSGDNCCGPKANYAVMVARSRSATGPFETLEQATGKPHSIILEKRGNWFAPGHNSVDHRCARPGLDRLPRRRHPPPAREADRRDQHPPHYADRPDQLGRWLAGHPRPVGGAFARPFSMTEERKTTDEPTKDRLISHRRWSQSHQSLHLHATIIKTCL